MIQTLSELRSNDVLFVHVCCAPCLANPLPVLARLGCRTEYFFFNPNIHPYAEYARRAHAATALLAEAGFALDVAPYDPAAYFDAIRTTRREPDRCRICYRLRMEHAAHVAASRGATHFTTSLLSSPFQKHDLVKEEGVRAARDAGLSFVYYDLRDSYYAGVQRVRERGLYRQSYCGCVFSEIDRIQQKPARLLAQARRASRAPL